MRNIKRSHLDVVERALVTEKPITIQALAKKMRCSYMAAKRRLFKWAELNNVRLAESRVREGDAGPESVAYSLTK